MMINTHKRLENIYDTNEREAHLTNNIYKITADNTTNLKKGHNTQKLETTEENICTQ